MDFQVETNTKQMAQLQIRSPQKVPNIMFFHPKWLDEQFLNVAWSVILQLRSTEKSNLKRLLLQSISLDRCVTKWGDIVSNLLRAGVDDFSPIKLEEVKSWHQFLVYIVNLIAVYQGWDRKLIALPDTRKNKIRL